MHRSERSATDDAAPGPAGRAWMALAAALALGALAATLLPPHTLDWQPARAWAEPWRAWTAAFVHWSPRHLAMNLAGCMLVALFGLAARVDARTVLAWLAAWPLTHAALALQPALAHYGGLSGVLHAGVAAAAVMLAWQGPRGRRLLGVAVTVGLAAKVAWEQPWVGPLAAADGLDIAVAPLAHASGAVAGALCAAVARAWPGGLGR